MKLKLLSLFILLFAVSIQAQVAVPRESQRQEISQTVGDTKISVVYHRPNTKGRTIFGCQTTDVIPVGGKNYDCLVPSGQVWRTGANENTTFEVTNDVTVNGQKLPKGKYGLHTIPNQTEWTIIFNKVNNEWGSFKYDEKQDQLRVTAKPQTGAKLETMAIDFNNVSPTATEAMIAWGETRVPLTIDVGDVPSRVLTQLRTAVQNRKPEDAAPLNQAASYVLNTKTKASYNEALDWLDQSLKVKETYGVLNAKARLLAEAGKKQEAIATAEKAIQVGKAATPTPANTAALEKLLADWKAGK